MTTSMLEELKIYNRQKRILARDIGIPEKDVQDAVEEVLQIVKNNGGTATLEEIETAIANNPDSELQVYVIDGQPDKLQRLMQTFDAYFDVIYTREGKRLDFNLQE